VLEKMGDAVLKMMAMEELPKIFGRRNYEVITIILDHAVSNIWLRAVVEHYKIQRWVRVPPNPQQGAKPMANIFEAWVGAHVLELQQYDSGYPLTELRHFLNRLWSLRYRDLKPFVYNATTNGIHFPPANAANEVLQRSVTLINSTENPVFQTVFGEFINAPNTNRDIGYLVTLKLRSVKRSLTPNETCYYAFSPSENEAKDMARLMVWSEPGMSV
jgi:hypothetical protein